MSIIVANISWNPYQWRQPYQDTNTDFEYIQNNPGHESLNFDFNKNGIDNAESIHGYFQRTNDPTTKRFSNESLIIFQTKDTDTGMKRIVGVYGGASIINRAEYPNEGFENGQYYINVRGRRSLSMRFPIYLEAYAYNIRVGRVGYKYMEHEKIDLAKRILRDELIQLSISGQFEGDFEKLRGIYSHYFNERFSILNEEDTRELNSLDSYYQNRDRNEVLYELLNTQNQQNQNQQNLERVTINGKRYKRSNIIISQVKKIRGCKCQIPGCGWELQQGNGRGYIEAAHIKPKYEGGTETTSNIVLLCPNHHKEFDFGVSEYEEPIAYMVRFRLNNQWYIMHFETRENHNCLVERN